MNHIFEQYGQKAKTESDPFIRYAYEMLHNVGKKWDKLNRDILLSAQVGSTPINYIFEKFRLEQQEIDWLHALQAYREKLH